MPDINKLEEKYAAQGLHVVSVFVRPQPLENIEKQLTQSKVTYPVALDGFQEVGYVAEQVPTVWIIGTDGKIKYTGREADEAVLKAEIAKVGRPGLGTRQFTKEADAAAKAYSKGDYAEAWKLATALAESDASEAVMDDAEFLVERIEERRDTLMNRLETAEVERDYASALKALEVLAARFSGVEETEEVEARLKEMRENPVVKGELAATDALLRLLRRLEFRGETGADLAGELEKFAEEHQGTRAAEEAAERAENLLAAKED